MLQPTGMSLCGYTSIEASKFTWYTWHRRGLRVQYAVLRVRRTGAAAARMAM